MSTELFEAIEQHDLDRLATLLAGGADANAMSPTENGYRPLHAAINELDGGGSIEAVVLLLRYGADPNRWDAAYFAAPLIFAINSELREAVRLLLAAGADPNVRDYVEGDSPLRWSVEHDDRELAAMLLRCGATRTIDEGGGISGNNALGRATYDLNVLMLELLLAAGADPEALDADGRTARQHLPPRETSDPALWDAAAELLARTSPRAAQP